MDGSIRELRASDATSILDAFLSDGDMARQGDVTSLEQAHAYIENFTVPHRQARVAAENGSDRVLAFVGASIDSANQNGWAFYWAHADARGRGITSSLVRSSAMISSPPAGFTALSSATGPTTRDLAVSLLLPASSEKGWSARSSLSIASGSML